MNFKTPKMKDVTSVAVQGVSAVVGGMVSNLAVAEIIGEKKTEQKDEDNKSKRKLVKGIALGVSLGASAFIQGEDTSAKIVKGALLGSAVAQAVSLAKEFVKTGEETKMLGKAAGLGCACEQPLGNPTWFSPVTTYSYDVERLANYQEKLPVVTAKKSNPLVNFSKGQLKGYSRSA